MSLSKYLRHYCEPLEGIDFNAFPVANNVLVIPAYDEPLSFIDRLLSFLHGQHNVLVIVVINQPDDEPPNANNEALLEKLTELPSFNQKVAGLYCAHGSYIYCVNHALPRKQGVGLARKLGCDIAVHLYAQQKLSSPWLHGSDADVVLPEDYFSATSDELASSYAAALYPFKHHCENTQTALSVALYEMRLHWYVAGLRWAKSPYAVHTIGSTIAVNIGHYCKVRGFPKLAAGEDFHLLNKLAKTGAIHRLAAPTLQLDGRESMRVPFGTGRAVSHLDTLDDVHQAMVFEAPETFSALKQVLSLYPDFWLKGSADKALQESGLSEPAIAALQHTGFAKVLAHAYRQANTGDQFQKQLNIGFDALQSRRFIHYLAEHCFSNENLSTLHKQPLALEILPSLRLV